MRIGLHLPNFTWPEGPVALRDRLTAVARTADDAGFSFITVMDHFFQIGVQGPVEMEMLEGCGSLTPAQALGQVRALGEAGVQLVNFSMPNVSTLEPLEIFGREIIPVVADLGDPPPTVWWS
jgi:hypothetical protein